MYIISITYEKPEPGTVVKVAFFRGASLRPAHPGSSKSKDTRYLDIHADDQLDEAQLAAWVKQASQLPGERM